MINTGIVIKSTGSWYKVKTNNKYINCKLRGKFKTKGIIYTNPIAVGDKVDFNILKEENTGFITKLHERKNVIIRKSINLSRKAHIIATNVDVAFVIITIKQPKTSTVFIDRYLVSAQAYNIPIILVFNKIDIYDEKDIEEMDKLISIYEKIGYQSLKISAKTKKGIDKFNNLLKNKLSVISGNSGVGKSTLINTINPNLDLKTEEISNYHKKGKHTTTFSEMFEIQKDTFVVDTPGIKGFGLVNLENENLSTYFPEMLKLQGACKYYNCTHTHEPNCAILSAVEDNKISKSRYKSYLSLLNDDNEKYREDIYK